jgi:TRAP-type mannitol/chloroaromatic compound transport system permease large subunit
MPPFDWALFFLRGVVPPELTKRHLYRGVIAFIALQILGLTVRCFFPQIALRLPKTIGWQRATRCRD